MNPGAAQSRASGRSPDCGIRKNTSTKKSGFFVFQSVSNCFKVLQFPAFLTTPARNPHNRVYDLERRAIYRSGKAPEVANEDQRIWACIGG
jgi:hypothetical protein